jgi:DNA uptake protein ComE-like DNA-binding protein
MSRLFRLLGVFLVAAATVACAAETDRSGRPLFRQVDPVEAPGTTATEVEGIGFSVEEVKAVLWGVNHASLEELDGKVGLTSQAADSLIALAPFETVEEIGAAPYVGAAALGLLRDHASVWADEMNGTSEPPPAPTDAGTYDGVEFDEPTAAAALTIANEASFEELTGAGAMNANGTHAIVDGRPFATLADVSDTYGVGPATMQALHDYAAKVSP